MQRQVKDLPVERGQPCYQAVIDQIGADPQTPDHKRPFQVDAAEQLAPVGSVRRLRVGRVHHRVAQNKPAPCRIALQQFHHGVSFRNAALGGKPARRFGHEPAQGNREDRRDQTDNEHRLPAVDRHQEEAHHAGEHQADRENHLIQEEEAAALLRADELIDVGARHRHLAAGADPLQEAEGHHRRAAPGKQTRDIHRHEQHDGDEQGLQAADTLGQRSEQKARQKVGRHSPLR